MVYGSLSVPLASSSSPCSSGCLGRPAKLSWQALQQPAVAAVSTPAAGVSPQQPAAGVSPEFVMLAPAQLHEMLAVYVPEKFAAAAPLLLFLQEQDGQLCGPPPPRPAASVDEEDAADQQSLGIINGSQLMALLSRMSAS